VRTADFGALILSCIIIRGRWELGMRSGIGAFSLLVQQASLAMLRC
jgi:hypothetical protein